MAEDTQQNVQPTDPNAGQQQSAQQTEGKQYTAEELERAKQSAPDPSKILGDDQSFFQDPFIDPNSTSFDERKKQILQMQIPPHSLQLNSEEFRMLVAESISLTFQEKQQIIQSLPRLTQFQVDELLKILRDEKKKFEELNKKHMEKLKELEENAGKPKESIEEKAERLMREKEDQSQADQLLKEIENL